MTVASTTAKTMFMIGPATATAILAHGEISGSGSASSLLSPSSASLVSICGSFTKPPAGIMRTV